MKRIVAGCMTVMLMIALAITVHAHGGRTDSSGGHKDNENVSGLGWYHYHCGGHPAHLHNNGVCPYKKGSSSSSSSSSKSSSSSSSASSASAEWEKRKQKALASSNQNSGSSSSSWSESNAALENAKQEFWSNPERSSSYSYVEEAYIEVVGIELFTPEETTIRAGDKVQLECQFFPLNATDQSATWIVSNGNVASIAEDGLLTAKAPGKINVTIVSHNGYNDTVSIIVKRKAIDWKPIITIGIASVLGLGFLWNCLIRPLIELFQLAQQEKIERMIAEASHRRSTEPTTTPMGTRIPPGSGGTNILLDLNVGKTQIESNTSTNAKKPPHI